MLNKFIKRMFGGKSEPEEARAIATEQYSGFEITAAPVNETNGWRVAGRITKEIDGTPQEHLFARADTCSDPKTAAELTLRKARQLIDEQGEKIFK